MRLFVRYPELDFLRTVAIILMVVYHFAFDLRFFFGIDIDVLHGRWLVLQRITVNLFLLLTGISAAISLERKRDLRHVLRRFGTIATAALLVTVATRIVLPDTYVRFGILHLIGTAALLLPFFAPLKEKTILVGIFLIIFAGTIRRLLPASILLIPIGSPPTDFHTLDYFPLLPWFGTILIGFGLGHLFYVRLLGWRTLLPPLQPTTHNLLPHLSWPGRHSLLIYLLHQPIILLALWMTLR